MGRPADSPLENGLRWKSFDVASDKGVIAERPREHIVTVAAVEEDAVAAAAERAVPASSAEEHVGVAEP